MLLMPDVRHPSKTHNQTPLPNLPIKIRLSPLTPHNIQTNPKTKITKLKRHLILTPLAKKTKIKEYKITRIIYITLSYKNNSINNTLNKLNTIINK